MRGYSTDPLTPVAGASLVIAPRAGSDTDATGAATPFGYGAVSVVSIAGLVFGVTAPSVEGTARWQRSEPDRIIRCKRVQLWSVGSRLQLAPVERADGTEGNASGRAAGTECLATVTEDPWRLNEIVRCRRLREHGRRPPSVNLAEGLALNEFLSGFCGAARR